MLCIKIKDPGRLAIIAAIVVVIGDILALMAAIASANEDDTGPVTIE